MEPTRERINEIVAEGSGFSAVSITADFDLVNVYDQPFPEIIGMVIALEDEWDIELSDDDVAIWRTVGDVYRTLGVGAGPSVTEGGETP